MNEYKAIYNETSLAVRADNFYNAQQIAAKQFNTKKSHLVEVMDSITMNQAMAA